MQRSFKQKKQGFNVTNVRKKPKNGTIVIYEEIKRNIFQRFNYNYLQNKKTF